MTDKSPRRVRFRCFAVPVFTGGRPAVGIGWLVVASGVLALAGLSGVAAGDMRLRNIGIVGYVGAGPREEGVGVLRTLPALTRGSGRFTVSPYSDRPARAPAPGRSRRGPEPERDAHLDRKDAR